jgi:single-strand DNA-binding protein
MNTIQIMGNVGKDPEISHTAGATPLTVAKFTVAVSVSKDVTDWHNVKVIGKQAEFVEKHIRKGFTVAVTGAQRNERYTNKDGQPATAYYVMADRVHIAKWAEAKEEAPKQEAPKPATKPAPAPVVNTEAEDDLPF